ncbi:YciI family protein [Nonomuraea antri]|uniref:YciI family protein n=1 Tax=Nonomuraea antri TaxID=2730852 RepID=UPI001C2C5348|nr:YciI family protein [Nonomuraea antri]
MIVGKGNAETEAGVLPSQEVVDAMHAFNEELTKAGVLLAAEGLYPSSRGAQISYSRGSGRGTVIDGPFAEAKELIAGFWLIQVKSREEALQWALRVPIVDSEEEGIGLDVWQVFDASDPIDESLSPAEAEQEAALRERLSDPS